MLTFRNIAEQTVTRVEVVSLCTIEDGVVMRSEGRPGHDPLFMVKIYWMGNFEPVPTGFIASPWVDDCAEMIITNGDDWYTARHATPEQLTANRTEADRRLHIVPKEDIAPRVQRLTIKDKNYIVVNITKYCNEKRDVE